MREEGQARGRRQRRLTPDLPSARRAQEGGRPGSGARPDPPRESAKGAGARRRSSERRLGLGEWRREARHLPEAKTLGVPWGRPSDPASTTLGVCETAGVQGPASASGC